MTKKTSSGKKHGFLNSFSIYELITIALFICLLYVAGLPSRLGLRRIPFISSFIYSIPFTAVLIIAIRLIPKRGSTLLILSGYGLFSQIIGQGINIVWWPYYLMPALAIELLFLVSRNYAKTLTNAVIAGALRGLYCYIYIYVFRAYFILHIYYAFWYKVFKISEGIIGSMIGAGLGFFLSKSIKKAYRDGGL